MQYLVLVGCGLHSGRGDGRKNAIPLHLRDFCLLEVIAKARQSTEGLGSSPGVLSAILAERSRDKGAEALETSISAEQLQLCQRQEHRCRVGVAASGVPATDAMSRSFDKNPRRR